MVFKTVFPGNPKTRSRHSWFPQTHYCTINFEIQGTKFVTASFISLPVVVHKRRWDFQRK